MTRRAKVVGGAALAAVALLLCLPVMAQDQTKEAAKEVVKEAAKQAAKETAKEGMAGADAQMAEAMAKWQETNAKGPEHERFKEMVGNWTTESKWWTAPGTEPTVSKGTAEFKLILDGRYVEQKYHCEGIMPGQGPFEGIGIEGFDRMKKKYVSIWMDNMSTGIFMAEGTADDAGKVFTYTGKADDPMTGQKDKVYKSICRIVDPDKVVYEMYDTTPGGKEFMSMEITYTRKK